MKTGKALAIKKFDASATGDEKYMLFAMPSTPAVIDTNSDGYADIVYVGDMGGQVFKWVINGLGGDPINGTGSGDLVSQPNWTFKRFFSGHIEDDSGTYYFQNLFHAPAVAYVGGKLYLAFGAGERINLSYEGDASIDENNRFYVVSDPDPFETSSPAVPLATESDLVDATSSPGGVSLTTQRGFYIKAAEGEKFAVNPVIFAGQVVTASFAPTNTGVACTARGNATAYVFDVTNGEGFFEDENGDPMRAISIGVGLPTDPKVSVGPGGGDNRVYIEKSGADLESIGVEDVSAGGRLLYWRQVD
jgi:type IV pilus assembly protein PilY1